MRFKVGQKVVCVDAGPTMFGRVLPLVLNRVYTVSGIDQRWMQNAAYAVFLAELPDMEDAKHFGSFRAGRFRPAVERKTDISFTTGADSTSERWDNRVKVPALADSGITTTAVDDDRSELESFILDGSPSPQATETPHD